MKESIYSGYTYEDIEYKHLYKPPYSYTMGIDFNDFIETPYISLIGVFLFFLLTIFLIIFGFLDRKYDFLIIKFTQIHFLIFSILILPSIVIISTNLRYISLYFLCGHHWGYGEKALEDLNLLEFPQWTFTQPYLLIILSVFILMIAFTMIDSDLRILFRENEQNKIKIPLKNTG